MLDFRTRRERDLFSHSVLHYILQSEKQSKRASPAKSEGKEGSSLILVRPIVHCTYDREAVTTAAAYKVAPSLPCLEQWGLPGSVLSTTVIWPFRQSAKLR